MLSDRYFQDPKRTRGALRRYASFVGGKGEKGWSIAVSKLGLYRPAIAAFAESGSEVERRAKHEEVYESLRKWWGVGRNGTLWDATKIFGVLTDHCQACSRSYGVNLATLENESQQQAILDCLKRLRGLKQLRSGKYPVMAVSKNLHFFNQRLWVIYDTDVILNKVFRVFKQDWGSFYAKIAVTTRDEWINFYLAYLLWASHMIRTAYPRLMDDFANWFIEAVNEEGANADDFRDELRLSYATAFEFIAIGAAHLEGAGTKCW